MHRRALLRTGVAGIAGTSLGLGSAVATRQDSYEPLARLGVSGARETVVDGTDAYVATRDGFTVVDIADPRSPAVRARRTGLMAEFDRGPLERVQDLWIDGDRLVAAGPADPSSDRNLLKGVVLYDIANPSDPVLLDEYETSFAIHNTAFDDGVVYLTNNRSRGNPIVLLSTEGDEFAELSRWSLLDQDDGWASVSPTLYNLHDVAVQDGLAYLLYWDGGTWILDVSDPATPEYVGDFGDYEPADLAGIDRDSADFQSTFLGPPGNHHTGAISDDGSVLALGTEAWAVEIPDGELAGGPGGVELWDVSDPASPTQLSTIEPPESADNTRGGNRFTTAHNFDIAGDRLYTSWYYGGVKLHDISDPTDPTELAWWRAPDEATFWTAQAAPGREFFVGSSTDFGTNQGALYTFPDRAGEQADPPSLGDGSSVGGGQRSGGSSTGQSNAADEANERQDGGSDGVPGFGIGAAGVGLGIGALRLLAGRDDE